MSEEYYESIVRVPCRQDDEYTNADRAKGIEAYLMARYECNSHFFNVADKIEADEIRDALADIRHLCDLRGIDFFKECDRSYEAYREEVFDMGVAKEEVDHETE